MKHRLLLIAVLFVTLLSACGPAQTGFNGQWTTNVAILTLTQNGNQVTGTAKGYGGYWDVSLTGVVSGATLTFNGDTPLGPLAIVLSADGQTFKSADPSISFCGSRDSILPAGCGFSGKWNLKMDLVPAGAYAQLQQKGGNVTGAVYGPDNKKLVPLNAAVNWGKGWQAVGKNDWGDFTLSMGSDEKGFQISNGNLPSSQWCGLREGETSAYLFYFTCTVP